jgi:phenol 2-monooxygenase
MPVFQEISHESRDFRILPSRELPLPRMSPRPVQSGGSDKKHEVVVIGVRSTLIAGTEMC